MARISFIAAIITGLMATAATGLVQAAQPVGNAGKICSTQTALQERETGIPRHLLQAISLAETGRWDADQQATIAWPWTVMARGQGRFFATRQGALDYIHSLRRQGVTNIDVGCMQINLFYHGKAFASIEQALDPVANTAYAAAHLKNLYQTTRSWTQAAAFYHSSTPDRARAYKMKVLKLWNQTRRTASAATTATATAGVWSAITVASTEIDHVRMAQLDRQRKIKLKATAKRDPAGLRRGQLAAWKSGSASGLNMGQMASLRRVKLESQRRRQFRGTERDVTGEEFAVKRRQELTKWRLFGHLPGSG